MSSFRRLLCRRFVVPALAVGLIAVADLGGCQKRPDPSAPGVSEPIAGPGTPAPSLTNPGDIPADGAAATLASPQASSNPPPPARTAAPRFAAVAKSDAAAKAAGTPSSSPAATPSAAATPAAAEAGASAASSSALAGGSSRTSLADLLPAGTTLSDPTQRAKVVAQMRASEQQQKTEASAKADKLGIAKRVQRPDGSVIELIRFEGDKPIYIQTHNINASLSTNATALRTSPYSVTGFGVTVGVWDGGSVRSTHQEFGSRVSVKDGASLLDHSTHVGGTIAASGVDANAKGMATAVKIESYEWNSDKSEMTARGAAYPAESGTIYLSNHSYGYVGGWTYTGYTTPKWNWYGSGTTSTGLEDDFGKYDTNARDSDSLAASLPYYLMFRSAGNDRADIPAKGDSVSLSTSTSSASAVSYDPAKHPGGDGTYKNGYDSLGFDAVAKDIVTVGAVADAVSNGARDLTKAKMLNFSSWGPTDDGRIKPDLVANGDQLYSALSTSNTAYGSYSGTSMSSPNATGTAALLVNFFDKLFPGQAMRASTLKALLIQTADDLGTAGPDYQYGWGLINGRAAADVIQAYKSSPGTKKMIEDRISTTTTSRSYNFVWNGTSAIRATLCWTDPAATAATTGDAHTARLVNNLDLKITGPNGTSYQPYVMPYVGDWTAAKLSAAATKGKNNTDNIEQVYLAAPPAAGTYTAVVTYDGTLTNSAQDFSLIISGGAASAVAAAPTAQSVTPTSGSSGTAVLTVSGANFKLGASVKLKKSGQTDVAAFGHEVMSTAVKCRVKLSGLASGAWDLVVTNPDGQSATLSAAFTVAGSLWSEDFEGDVSGWTQGASIGATSTWALSTSAPHGGTEAVFASAPRSRNVEDLYSPAITIPANASGLRLTFWQYYGFQTGRDGGVIEFSLDSGTTWFDVTAANSGASFAAGGYNTTLSTSGPANTLNPLAGRNAWSGSTAGYTQAALNLATASYAGKTLKIRWRLATDQSFGPGPGSGGGWYLDDIVLAGSSGPVNLAPSIVSAATATPNTVTAKTSALTVNASDDGGNDRLTYTWAATGEYYKLVQFSSNGLNSSKTTTATFLKAGTYTITVTVRDGQNLASTSAVDIEVGQTATGMTVTPGKALVGQGLTQQFTGTQVDQFGDSMSTQPTIIWTASGGGTIDSRGLFTAARADGGPFTVFAKDPNNRTASAAIEVWQAAKVLAGKYTALLSTEGATTGRVVLTVSASGALTGTLTTSRGSLSFKGSLDGSGHFALTVKSAALGTVVFDLQGGRVQGLALFEGSVTVNGAATLLEPTTQLATAALAGLTPCRFTISFAPDAAQTDSPQGYGWATAVLAKTGALTISGTLADGAALSLATNVHRDGEVPIYLPAKKLTSGVTGTLLVLSAANPPLSGSLAWDKFSTTTGRYSGGFSADLAVAGYRYVAPAAGDTILDYTSPPSAKLTLAKGGLATAAAINLSGKPIETTFVFNVAGSSFAALKLSAFSRSNGCFRGTLTLGDGGEISRLFSGVLLQGPNVGRGFFLGFEEAGSVQYTPAK